MKYGIYGIFRLTSRKKKHELPSEVQISHTTEVSLNGIKIQSKCNLTYGALSLAKMYFILWVIPMGLASMKLDHNEATADIKNSNPLSSILPISAAWICISTAKQTGKNRNVLSDISIFIQMSYFLIEVLTNDALEKKKKKVKKKRVTFTLLLSLIINTTHTLSQTSTVCRSR